MNRKQKSWIAIAMLHLVLVVCGAARVEWREFGLAGEPVAQYAALSGANNAYGFFAPGVGTHLRAVFEAVDAKGEKSVHALQRGYFREADLRIANIIGIFWHKVEDPTLRRSMTASWAAKIFSRNPSARRVNVAIESYDLPTMTEWRAGKPGKWDAFYSASYTIGEGR